ncbi:MAG: hypothetical protein GF400_04205 [Candidatus Eisenbacteria bacterium]|nr:hypothetical protein [Candidatus Eisenbacteria bacterium]
MIHPLERRATGSSGTSRGSGRRSRTTCSWLWTFVPGDSPPAAALIALLLAALLAGVPSLVAAEPPGMPASEASSHVGEMARVCGHVASAAYFGSVKGGPTFINLDRPYPDQTFTVVIWARSRPRFEVPPERLYDGKSICVTGLVETYRGKPQIEVTSPDQVVVTTPLGGGGELTDVERVFVKSLLASLGYDADYGDGEWDERTIEALVAFQEASGLPTTGDPDAETLRALANAAPKIPEEQKTLAIRLLLFELVRRQE